MLIQLGRRERERQRQRERERERERAIEKDHRLLRNLYDAGLFALKRCIYINTYIHAVHAYIHCVAMKQVSSCCCFTVFLVLSLYV